MKRIYIETYGCQMNEYDSELLFTIFRDYNYEKTQNPDEADIIFVNTCAIREHAEVRALGRISQLNRVKLHNKYTKLIVGGCMAQRMKDEIIKKLPFVDIVVGPDKYRELPLLIDNKKSNYSIVETEMNNYEIYDNIKATHIKDLSGFVAIMRGCDNFCTYCIVPYVRGRERSKSPDAIIGEIEDMIKTGYKEVTLIGQNVNSYNFNGVTFEKLLELVNSTGIERIRFTTSHPKDMNKNTIDKIADLEHVCEHIHLPMQSGSNNVLKRMNRKYTKEEYLEKVLYAKERIQNVAITTDLIVGFPGETDEDYKETIEVMQQVEFDAAFMFKYSPRFGTVAATFKDQIDDDIKQQRLEKMISLQQRITDKQNKKEIGSIQQVLIEHVSKKNKDEYTGRTRNNKWVIISGDSTLVGKLVNVRITNAEGYMLFGEII